MKTEEKNNEGGLPRDMIVVIGRQFGSGGRKVGKMLAEHLGLKYYDKELLNEAAVEFGFSREILAQADEKKPSLLSQLFISSFGVQNSFGPETLSGEGLYKVQSQVVRKLGEKGGCIIVGRTADYILRDHPHMASLFFHSPIEVRAQSICQRGESECLKAAMEKAHKADKHRESYYNYFTGRKWGTSSNYDLSVDSSKFSDEELVEFIEHFLRIKLKF
ncbi:MAG: cytidylate kinase-like family protein [Clostridium sp.]|nr:cytidylate kinase-like family protein [Prevotella sp.]MCM1429451.1 cytidylate kinase-like family protein [Clostridium sp.]MCM1475514.1 cytidylate kinase-like family protein [Muribaculaceae bacterium]